jgi:galactokinase
MPAAVVRQRRRASGAAHEMGNRMKDFQGPWAAESTAAEQWEAFEELVRHAQAPFFEGNAPIAGARAPGRLDVMGGVADYSGSLVLEMPIAEAAFVAWQWREDRQFRIRSLALEAEGLSPDVTISLDEIVDATGKVKPIDEVSRSLTADPATRWAAYVAGCFYVMLAAYSKVAQGHADLRLGELGANVLLKSDVPLGAGLSSSAAIEVAAMHALSEAAGIHPSDMTLAAWCQRVENTIVGAPCGVMDQVASALGREDALIVLRCQPHDLMGVQPIPPGWRFVGIDSRVKHSVGGAHYTNARVGAFMGLKIIQLESGGKLLDNYLCKMSPAEFAEYRDLVPTGLTGREYGELYGRLPDTVTRVDEDVSYRPRDCAEHPILENYRVRQFAGLMQIAELRYHGRSAEDGAGAGGLTDEDRGFLRQAGELMYESHASYSDRLDLGSPETDLLVKLVRERGEERGLYGAKITGGGAGGTVAVLAEAGSSDVEAALTEVCIEYERRTGAEPRVFTGSSPGAVAFGARQILRG